MNMEQKEIKEQLKDAIDDRSDLNYLTNLAYKYCNAEESHGRRGPSIPINEEVDYIAFTKYLYQRGKSNNTIKSFLSYLAKWEIELNEDYITSFSETVEKKAIKEGFRDSNENKYLNFRYRSYLTLKWYLECMEEKQDKPKGHYTQHLVDTEKIEKPNNNPNTFKIAEKGVSPEDKPERERELIQQMLTACKDEEFDYSDTNDLQLIILLASDSGLRIGEILNLKPSWIDFYKEENSDSLIAGKINLPAKHTKTGRPQTAYINRKAREALQQQKNMIKDELDEEDVDNFHYIDLEYVYGEEEEGYDKNKDDDYIQAERLDAIDLFSDLIEFMADKLTYLSDKYDDIEYQEGGAKHFWQKMDEGRYENLTPHVLRHAFLRWVDDNQGIKAAKHQARHSDISTTMEYLEKGEEEKRQDYEELQKT